MEATCLNICRRYFGIDFTCALFSDINALLSWPKIHCLKVFCRKMYNLLLCWKASSWYCQVLNILQGWYGWCGKQGSPTTYCPSHCSLPTASTSLVLLLHQFSLSLFPPLPPILTCTHTPTQTSSVSLEGFKRGWWQGAHRGGLVTCRPTDSTEQSKCVMQGSRVKPKSVMWTLQWEQ